MNAAQALPAVDPFATSQALAARTGPLLPIDPDALFLDSAQARCIGEELAGDYCFAEPFPHIVIDNFLPEALARMALEQFPSGRLRSDAVFEMGYAGQNKRQILPEECSPQARRLFHFFNSAPFLQFLEGLTTIQGLIADPYFHGGGYHETGRGGYLGVHADFRINERLHVHRRLNVIIYLNPSWKAEYGGHLELWDRSMKVRHASVLPVFNRAVVFNTDASSYHGHPDPLTCPDDTARRSMALYYYTASSEIYREVPANSTIYHARPDDTSSVRREAFSLRLDEHLRQWVPPALHRYAFALKRRLVR